MDEHSAKKDSELEKKSVDHGQSHLPTIHAPDSIKTIGKRFIHSINPKISFAKSVSDEDDCCSPRSPPSPRSPKSSSHDHEAHMHTHRGHKGGYIFAPLAPEDDTGTHTSDAHPPSAPQRDDSAKAHK
jgi:hypothetical protein